MRRLKYGSKPTVCIHGHKHDSKREAARCVELHLLQKQGEITHLEVHPEFRFTIDAQPLRMGNGHHAKFTPDFAYREGSKAIVEDVKGIVVRDFPLRAALFRHLFAGWELRIVK